VNDTPSFGIVTNKLVNGQLQAVTAVAATITVYDLKKGVAVVGTPTVVIALGLITITIPQTMTANAGHYEAVVQTQLDSTPTYKTDRYEYSLIPALPATP